jgi:hypothetical protein
MKFSAYDVFLELHSSGMINIERLEIQLIQSLFSNKTKGHKQDNQNLLKSSVSEGGEP